MCDADRSTGASRTPGDSNATRRIAAGLLRPQGCAQSPTVGARSTFSASSICSSRPRHCLSRLRTAKRYLRPAVTTLRKVLEGFKKASCDKRDLRRRVRGFLVWGLVEAGRLCDQSSGRTLEHSHETDELLAYDAEELSNNGEHICHIFNS